MVTDVLIAALAVVGGAMLAMLVAEVHESASILARWVTCRAAHHLGAPMADIREEEWLALLGGMDGLHIARLIRSLGFFVAAMRIEIERGRATPESSEPPGAVDAFEDANPLDVDSLLDEIDDVGLGDAEEFVRTYRQASGE